MNEISTADSQEKTIYTGKFFEGKNPKKDTKEIKVLYRVDGDGKQTFHEDGIFTIGIPMRDSLPALLDGTPQQFVEVRVDVSEEKFRLTRIMIVRPKAKVAATPVVESPAPEVTAPVTLDLVTALTQMTAEAETAAPEAPPAEEVAPAAPRRVRAPRVKGKKHRKAAAANA
jgi:hypothetical protein